jgi:ferredoxin
MPTVLVKNLSEQITEKKFELNSEEIIYDGLQRQGLELPHGCLAGSCGACRIEILEGENNLKPPSAVEADTIKHIQNTLSQKSNNAEYMTKNIRLSCRARVLGDITFTRI